LELTFRNIVTYFDWAKVLAQEEKAGKEKGKPREKFLQTADYERIIGKQL